MDARYRIRRATAADAAALAEIEHVCFSDPWSMVGIIETIQYATVYALVAENGESVAGYIMARISGEEGEILNLAVMPGHRRRGVARALLEAGLSAITLAGVREAYLEVRESNRAAVNLYQAFGFGPVGLRPNYYRNPLEDALVLRAALSVQETGT
ncbi:MAG: ribosomal protein S18-alanine N-acetyltransferase [Gemmatimonadales bacterium]|nr:ribosomal protein S18-alanine N-acetyltransferase [Gemmatimonadales bacterium]